MIEVSGYLNPPKELFKAVNAVADNSFCRCLSADEITTLPTIPSWSPDRHTNTCLRLRNVEPHTDDFIGLGRPKTWRGMFWLLRGNLWIQAGADAQEMSSGDWVLFDDTVNHCVVAEKQWVGIAVQYVRSEG